MPSQDNKYIRLIRVWLALAKISIIREMEFRSNFVLGIVRQFLWLFAFLFSISVIFQHTNALSGWTQAEVIIILSLSRIFEGLIDITITRNITEFPVFIQKGTFDYILTKPLPSQLYTAFRTVNIYIVGNVLAGLILLGSVLASGAIQLNVSAILLFIWVSIAGFAIFYSMLIMTSSLAFFFERLESLWGLMSLYTEPLTVPINIFPKIPRIILTYVIPVAFIVFVPAQALTKKIDWHIGIIATIIAIAFVSAANIVWRIGLSRYTSASS